MTDNAYRITEGNIEIFGYSTLLYKKEIIMKKTLAAVAVLGAFAGSALAADVTLYGVMDLGFGFDRVDNGTTTTNDWAMKAGQDSGNRIGFKGSEQISEDLTVGFQLETQFSGDTGKNKDTFFHRESRLYVQTPYGELGFGRMGALDSTTGSYNLAGSGIHATTGVAGAGSTGIIFLGQNDRHNNTVTYKSPKFAGVTVYAQASTGIGGDDTDGNYGHDSDRYYGLGATYDVGAFHSALIVSSQDYKDVTHDAGVDDGLTVTAGASYDFGVTKAFVAGQYFDNVKAGAKVAEKILASGAEGYGLTVGAKTPVMGGVLTTQVGYSDAESVADSNDEYGAYNVAVLYHYNLSKRTTVYGAVGYAETKWENSVAGTEDKTKTTSAGFGLIHKF